MTGIIMQNSTVYPNLCLSDFAKRSQFLLGVQMVLFIVFQFLSTIFDQVLQHHHLLLEQVDLGCMTT